MRITVLFFATLKERAGVKQTELELPEGSLVNDLKARLAQDFPNLAVALGSTLVSINRDFAFDEDPVPPGAEVAVFPPVSGGAAGVDAADSQPGRRPTIFAITEEVLDLDDLLAQITLPSTGAACLFTGIVRGVTARGDAHQTVYLEYEAYRPMAEAKMRQVAEEVRSRWPSVEGIAVVQRIGHLDPGTPTVLIACTAAHRDTGVFEAARYGIDRLKEIVPVWKKEVGPQGETWVEGKYFPERGE
ncbi:MAG TPA: molybdenum cofactor biosynthesis protein MoaE [Anaerolineales bacterium]